VSGVGSEDPVTLCAPLGHPVRVQILAVINEKPMSPSQFIACGLLPRTFYKTYPQALSLVSYHFRELEKVGCLTIIDTVPARGAVEHIYAGLSHLNPDRIGSGESTPADRSRFRRISLQGLFARADSAARGGALDGRLDWHLNWTAMTLDGDGWSELQSIFARAEREIDAVREAADEEPEETAPAGDDLRIDATVGLLAFETPRDLEVSADLEVSK
jgi:hypothetical protein